MDCSAIPEKHHISFKVTKEVAKEIDNLHTGNIDRMEIDVQSQTFTIRGNSNARDDGDPIPLIMVPENGSFSHGRPGLSDVGDEQKSGFIEKGQMGFKFLGFFLYAAKWSSSSEQWPLRLSPALCVPASGNSTPVPSSTTIHDLGDSVPRNAFRLPWPSSLASTDRWSNLLTEVLSPGFAAVSSSAMAITRVDVQALAWVEARLSPSSDRLGTSVPPNSKKISVLRQWNDNCVPPSARQWLDASSFPVVWMSRRVSCP